MNRKTKITLLVILIASLGLFGLSMFLSELRIKEISIRKVHGAGMIHVMYSVMREYLVLLILAWLVSWPASWFIISGWLQNFPYRTGFTWWIFLLAGVASIALLMISLGYQTLQAIRSQPAESLKYE